MDRAGIESLYAHLDFAWKQIVEVIGEAGEDTFTRPAPGSGWPALRDCLAHIVFGYDRWIAIMTAQPMKGWREAVRTLQEADAARSLARGQVDSLLGRLRSEELQEMRQFNIDGESMPYSYSELLTHLALHERGHHGDVTTLFYQLGIGGDTLLDYRFHLGRSPV
jgi:uncharacterized damage-inducible protein DinB